MRTLIRSGLVVDGTGAPPRQADVLIEDGAIRAIGPDPGPADRVVDATGAYVLPGFVDMHSHSDLLLLAAGEAGQPSPGDVPKLAQGVTTQVLGQDGLSAAPVRRGDEADYAASIMGLDGTIDPHAWAWHAYEEYLDALAPVVATNVVSLVGHATIRRTVMGMEARTATGAELEAMSALLDRCLAAGAGGISTGLVYPPAVYADTAELVALCTVAARHGKPLFIHVRNEGDAVLTAAAEALHAAATSGVHLHYSHIKVAGRDNWAAIDDLLAQIDEAQRRGVAVTSDLHPYVAGSTMCGVLLPPWVHEGGLEKALARLADPDDRARMREQMLQPGIDWDNWYRFSDGWNGLYVAGVSVGTKPEIVGRSFAELLRDAGHDDLESEAAFGDFFDLLRAERLGISIVSFNNCEPNLSRFMAQPYNTIGTDGLVNPGGRPHPRIWGTFPRFFGRYVRDQGVLGLAEAAVAASARAADILSLPDRGRLLPGLRGDVVVMEPDVIDLATFETPNVAPRGIRHVLVNGDVAVEHGALTGSRAGRVLRLPSTG